MGYMAALASCLLLLLALPPGWISAWTWVSGLRWIYVFAIAYFLANVLMPFAIFSAPALGAMDWPDQRKAHSIPTPRTGGLALFAAAAFAVWRGQFFTHEVNAILAAGAVIFVLGAVEDCKGLSALVRLIGQIAASLIIVANGMVFNFPGNSAAGNFWSGVLTVVWLVGITNAFNFLDGIDGLVGGLGLVCSILFMGVAWNTQQFGLAFMCAALAGSCAAFLQFNWHPARVFLGDSGATLIGFLLASFAVYGGWATDNPMVAFATPLLILGIPVFDMIYITAARIHRGDVRTLKQWIEFVGRDHLHHRLLHLGFPVPKAVAFVLLLNIILGMGAWTMHYTASAVGTLFLLMQSVLLFVLIAALMISGRELKDGGQNIP